MDEDLLTNNMFNPDLNVSNEYIDNKTTRNNVHKVFEKSYVYNINSKNRESIFLTKIEPNNEDGTYTLMHVTDQDSIQHELIDVEKLNSDYNALNIPDSVVNPYVMKDNVLYFKKFLYQYPNDYEVQLPYSHTNVKMIRVIGSFLPYNINNVTKFNNHIAIDVLFGNDQQQENTDINLTFGTNIVTITPGNYTIDEVCSKIVNEINNYYTQNFVNGSGNSIYDNIIENNLFHYDFNSLTKEIKFVITQPTNQEIIESQTILGVTTYENLFYFITENTISSAVLNVKDYDNFLSFIQQLSSSMNLAYCDYNMNNYKQQFSVLLRNNNYYLCSVYSEFSLNTDIMPNLSTVLNIDPHNSVDSVIDEINFIDVTQGYDNYIAFSTNTKNRIYFSIQDQEYIAYIPDRYYGNYEDFIMSVVNSMNESYSIHNGIDIDFNFEIQQQLMVQDSTMENLFVNRYYISCSLPFYFNCQSMSKNASKIFGYTVSTVVYSTVHSIKLENDNFYYSVSGTNNVHFIFNNIEYTTVIESKNYTNYSNLLASIVNSMNFVCNQGYFSYEPLENSQNNYKICCQGSFKMQFSKMPALGSVLFYPPVTYDIDSINNCIELTNGYDVFSNILSYNAYKKTLNKFYLSIREQEPTEPYEDMPEFTNRLFIIDIEEKTYSDIHSLMSELVNNINDKLLEIYFDDNGDAKLTFGYEIQENKITFSCNSIPANKYEFNINSNLMPDICSFIGIDITKDVNYYTSYTSKYDYGNRLRFKMSFENSPEINERDHLWYMLGYRLNNSVDYIQHEWSNMFNFGKDSYHFTNLDFIDNFIPRPSNVMVPSENFYRPYRFPSMDKKECIYLKLNNYENIYDPSLVNHKLFTQFHFDASDFGKYSTNNFIDKPYIFPTTLSKLDKLHLTFIDSNGNSVDFGDIDHYITIEIIELKDMLTNNNYNTRRGQNENENYTNAMFLNYGVNKK